MLCDNETCRKRGINCFDSSGSELVSDDEFCAYLRHIKCRVARLARTQIQKKLPVSNDRTPVPINAIHLVSRGTTNSSSAVNVNSRAREDGGTQTPGDRERIGIPRHIGDERFNVGKNPEGEFDAERDPDGKPDPEKDPGGQHKGKSQQNEKLPGKRNPNDEFEEKNDPAVNPPEPVVIPRHPRPAPGYANVVPGAKLFSYWIKCISKYCTKQLKVMLIAVIIGILMWMALVYGAILGASMCNNGQFPSLHFGSSQTGVSVF